MERYLLGMCEALGLHSSTRSQSVRPVSVSVIRPLITKAHDKTYPSKCLKLKRAESSTSYKYAEQMHYSGNVKCCKCCRKLLLICMEAVYTQTSQVLRQVPVTSVTVALEAGGGLGVKVT